VKQGRGICPGLAAILLPGPSVPPVPPHGNKKQSLGVKSRAAGPASKKSFVLGRFFAFGIDRQCFVMIKSR